MMKFKSLKKKFLSATATAALSVSLIFGVPAAVEASALDIIGAGIAIGAQAAQANAQINANIKYFDTTEEGRLKLYDSFREKYGVCEDVEFNSKLDRIMSNLSRGIAVVDPTINDKPYKYFISNQESINAACSMGRVMMVNVGTFRKITNEDELAAIVGHEMGHGQKSHVAKGNKKHLQKAITASIA